MPRLLNALREHRHVFIVVTLLTLATTFPTIIYVFKTDVFWHPAGTSYDVYIEFWDIWYGKQFLTGQADRFYTDQIFYPEGLSLAFHSFFIPHIILVNALNLLLPISNAFSLAYLLNIFLCALSAYAYLCWLFKDKWIALFGAIVFGLSPHVVGHPNHPAIASVAALPLAIYFLHRGITENRRVLVALAGLLAGLTSIVTLYVYICLMITLGFFVLALALARWRDKNFWINVVLLSLAVSISSFWRIQPLLDKSDSLEAMATWHGEDEVGTNAISFLLNHNNPLFRRLSESNWLAVSRIKLSGTSYLGYLPLLLILVGLLLTRTRRKMVPWVFLCALFLILRLGSHLHINGAVYPNILLPKFYLNQLLPVIFASFWEADHFMMGALLPFAVLICYGLDGLRQRYPVVKNPMFILALVVIVALEYHVPVQSDRTFPKEDGTISKPRLAFLEWLDNEDDDVHLINLPMGRQNSKIYNLYQALSGFPHAEGAISRTPESAYNYIRANRLLKSWYEKLPISCESVDRDAYLTGLAQLGSDGFSHVVYHLGFKYEEAINESFRKVEPSYADEYVWIFHLKDLRDSCNGEQSPHSSFTDAYASALQWPLTVDKRHGTVVVFPPTSAAADHFLRYLHHFADIDRSVVTVTSDEQTKIQIRTKEDYVAKSSIDLGQFAALWLLNSPQDFDAEQTPAFQNWFAKRFHLCKRYNEGNRTVIDLYLRADIPCSAMDRSSAIDIQYDSGVRLHNFSYDAGDDVFQFYLAWTNTSADKNAFSLQFFDQDGNKALQYDNVIYRDLLSTHEIDTSSLPQGAYSIQLIVYDFETQVSIGGTLSASGQRFEREHEIANIAL